MANPSALIGNPKKKEAPKKQKSIRPPDLKFWSEERKWGNANDGFLSRQKSELSTIWADPGVAVPAEPIVVLVCHLVDGATSHLDASNGTRENDEGDNSQDKALLFLVDLTASCGVFCSKAGGVC